MKFTYPPESRPLDGFTIKRAIHRGGFGEVYYALSDGGREVALKLLQHQWDVELRGVTQCLNLKHANLVDIHDVRTDADGGHWIVMEYVSGPSLDEVVAEHPQGMPVERVAEWLAGLATGLAFLHDRGIVHRDLKPANVYREQGVVKIGDVGLSKFITQSRRNAQTESVGTVYYMAPEVAHGRYGREVDVYSLGVMLYEMLSGRVPFEGETTGEILMKHLSEKPDLTPIPERLRPVLARALEKDPLKRTPSAIELEREFRLALAGRELPQDIPEDSFAPATRSVPRHGSRGERRPDRRTERSERPANDSIFHGPYGMWLRVAIVGLIAMAIFAPSSFGGLVRALFVGGMFGAIGYGGYRLFTAIFVPAGSAVRRGYGAGGDSNQAVREAELVPVARTAAVPVTIVRNAATAGRSLSVRDRFGELFGSLTFAVLTTSVLTAGLCAVSPQTFAPTVPGGDAVLAADAGWNFAGRTLDPGTLALFALVTVLGAWGLLASNKLTEGVAFDGKSRRGLTLLAGLVVGVGTFWLSRTLLVDLPYDLNYASPPRPDALFATLGSNPLYEAGPLPTVAGFATFFGALFLSLRWWKLTDADRDRRFRIRRLFLPALMGWLLPHLFAFPHGWGVLWATSIAIVVQLSAAWLPTSARSTKR